ncbi:hypothetical protein F5B20DRAFT_596234 [Whalleya microplaca]|nr:hypothetical protein F5B20DRAFT_596234 [Whalleya microplaca]
MAASKPNSIIVQEYKPSKPVRQPSVSNSERHNPVDNPSAYDIDESFSAILASFNIFTKLRQKQGESVDDINVEDINTHFLNDIGLKEDLSNVKKQGEDDKSFMHFLVKVPQKLLGRITLVDWAMKYYLNLYLCGLGDGDSILYVLSSKCNAARNTVPFRLFVDRYPKQVLDILRQTQGLGKLLSTIIPCIRTSDVPELIPFFGETPEKPKPTITEMVFWAERANSNRTECFAASAWRGSCFALVQGHCNSSQPVSKTKRQPPEEPGKYKDEQGRTPLHRAAKYCDCDEDQRKAQFNFVQRLLAWCPTALAVTDSYGRSPYLYRIDESPKDSKNSSNDTIAFLLKDEIMHLVDRDHVLTLLYGRTVTTQSLAVPKSRESEREIHLDLRELQNPESSSERLLTFIRALDFEDILQYVRIPQYPFRLTHPSGDETKLEKNESGRRDFESIFEVLKDKGVRKIHKLIVDDDDACLHQDEVIERLNRFEIEDFQWMKMDMSSSVLMHAVPGARTLRLFSSGNHSVLRDWSSTEGLSKMSMLEEMYVKIYRKTEPQKRTEGYARDFIGRMVNNCPQIRSIEISLEPLKLKHHEEWTNTTFLATTNKWIKTMEDFVRMMGRIQPSKQSVSNRIKVAVLDDGIDWTFAHEIICSGRSFYADKSSFFNGQYAWYSSSTGHGTLMAALMQKICPNIDFLIVRLDQTMSKDSVFAPTPELAAIRWATQMGVDIISMSWTIPGDFLALDQAVIDAQNAGILLFGSASDQGAYADKPYMAKLIKGGQGPVICIGGAREAGYGDIKALSEAEFFFPGQIDGITDSLPPMKSDFSGSTGSSVATALAVGFAALIMLLVDMLPFEDISTNWNLTTLEKYRKRLRDPNKIRVIFRDLLPQPDQNRGTEQRNAVIINVKKHFRLEKLRRSQNYPTQKEGKRAPRSYKTS